MRCAIIDVGSNTVKMNVYDVTPPDIIKPIISESATLGLLGYIIGGALSREGIDALCKTVASYAKLAADIAVNEIRCVATASLRSADNSSDVIAEVKTRTGCEIELITGESEALLGLEGVKSSLGSEVRTGVMVDMGGGSTEIVGFIDGRAVRAVSEPFGCLSLYSRFVSGVLPDKDELRELKKFVNSRMDGYDWLRGYGQKLYLVGGTARLIGRMYYELIDIVEQVGTAPARAEYASGYSFLREGLKELNKKFTKPSTEDIHALIRNAPDRVHTFVPGLAALTRITAACSAERLVVCFSGIREGYVKSILLKNS